MAYTATITKFGIQSGTEDTLYAAWSWPPSGFSYSTGGSTTTVSGSVEYYKAPSYSGYSIVDGLAAAGEKDTSLTHRKKIAVLNGYVSSESSWTGTSSQNGKMLSDLKSGKLIKSKSGSTTTSSSNTTPNTDHYRVVWQYRLDGIWYTLADEETKSKHSTATMVDNPYITVYRVRVLPVAKKYKKDKDSEEVAYWTASWTAWKTYEPPYRKPAQAPTPNLETGSNSSFLDYQAVASVSGITDKLSTYIIFELFINEQKRKTSAAKSARIKVGTGGASYTFKGLKASTNYVVRATASHPYNKTVNGKKKTYYTDGDPSGYSSVYSTPPANQPAPKVTVDTVMEDASSAKVHVKWKKDPTARKYTIQATHDKTYFNNNDSSGIQAWEFITVSSDAARQVEVQLNGHTTWYFRVVVTNAQGQESVPRDTKYYTTIKLGVKPAAPTTWTMTNSFNRSEPIEFFWVHNSVDSSWQTRANIKLKFADDYEYTIQVPTPPSGRDPSLVQEPNYSKSFTLKNALLEHLEAGSEIQWCVRTRGAYGYGSQDLTGYSDWSTVRAINVYVTPSLTLSFTDNAGTNIALQKKAHAYPLTVSGSVSALGQEFIGYDVSITALEDYSIIDETGHEIVVNAENAIFQKHITVSEGSTFNMQILPGDALLQNGINYVLEVVAAFDSGLTASRTIEFYTDWSSIDTYIPTASIYVDEDNICTVVSPMCMSLVYNPEYEKLYWDAAQTQESIDYDIQHGYHTIVTISDPDSYILSESEPSDWANTYMYYMTYSGGQYIPVPESDPPPAWSANTYYMFEPDNQQFEVVTDSDTVTVKVAEKTGSDAKELTSMTSLYLGSNLILTEIDESYELTVLPPADWEDDYTSYFTRTEEITYEQVDMLDEAPEWVADTYYALENDEYVLTIEKPEDWDTNYFDYYTKQVEEIFETVLEEEYAPEWEPNTYYKYNPPYTTYYGESVVHFKVYDGNNRLIGNESYPLGTYDSSSTEIDLDEFTNLVNKVVVELELKNLTDAGLFNIRLIGGQSQTDSLAANVEMAIYRIEYDGELQLIATGISNDKLTAIRDPHPSLDYARYRIVATDMDSGTVSYTDITPEPVNYPNIVLQWNESWSSSDAEADMTGTAAANEFYSGERIILPYNIEVSESNELDVALIDYAGRRNPVSYYGTKTGQSGSWSTVIPKDDTDTLYALRRLAVYRGDVYVREPSGIGYWAKVSVSMSNSYESLTIPVSISITRVDGGI